MNSASKVLWGEGLFLRPQHFQRQDAYHEARLHQIANALHPYAWGVRSMQIDKEALVNSSFRFNDLSVIFPDGEIYDAPRDDKLPPAVSLAEIPLNHQSITFSLAVPALNWYGENSSAVSTIAMRYIQKGEETPDLFTQAATAEVMYLGKQARLVSEFESLQSYISFPIARLRREATGGFALDPDFMAPCVSVKSNPLLFLQMRRLMDALHAKVNALYGHHREPSKSVIEFRSGDIASFWLLHTASAAFASLTHLFHHPVLHPERYFEQLLGLAGQLMTFSKMHSLVDLPVYKHEDPGPAFSKLHSIIKDLLETVISTRFFAVALSEIKPGYHSGRLDSGKIDDKTAFYLSVSADMPALELVEIVPLRVKIGAPDDVEKFVLSAMPGVRLVHSPQVPPALPVKPDTYYFSVESKGPLYERMLHAQAISIYAPSGIQNLKLELLAVTA
ncbi:MAG: type VI secretion system baseplate subunit TssK [Polaromonas sp.]|uniref:type VI secretion system baseplate subunit TssK n=1 Tax=Polaromonas sp. TaxID=1869339 RepID=UPI0017CC4693|nr:type VI secretion system baseplate subunit TssK [Polaromonas sp.]NMM08672.1 type VI secretion system baseplate subunit TssK [Polaromonas sp.]